MAYQILEYAGGNDSEIANFILDIQNAEAGLDLTIAEQPDLTDIVGAYQPGGFWIAVQEGRTVGTIGMLPHGRRAAVKRFFVSAEHRGRGGPAYALFQQLMLTAKSRGISELFLDTPKIATRSHAFYRRAGFAPISRESLPEDYEYPDRESVILRLQLA